MKEEFLKHRQDPNQLGMSLIEVLVAVALVGIIALAVAKVTTDGLKGAKSVEVRQDLTVVKSTLSSTLDCRETLQVGPGSTLPVACPSPLVLKRRGGAEIAPSSKLGGWTITPTCSGGELLIGVTKPGNDALTGQSFSARTANGVLLATDVFAGASDFCREYLDGAAASCTDPAYPIYHGVNRNGANCCQLRTSSQTTGPTSAAVRCAPSEYVAGGGAACETVTTGPSEPGFLHYSGPFYTEPQQGWAADCFDKTYTMDSYVSTIWALCCPR